MIKLSHDIPHKLKLRHDIPKKLIPLFTEVDNYDYGITVGGRSSGKSHQIATLLLMRAIQKTRLTLCTREYQNSIKDSVHRLLKALINRKWMCNDGVERYFFADKFEVLYDSIRGANGSEFIFKGLKDASGVKSFEGFTTAWIEEAENVSDDSYDLLLPTIMRDPGGDSKLFISFNPDDEQSATYRTFITHPQPRSLIIPINYYENPFCPPQMVRMAEQCRIDDPAKYRWIWEGNPKQLSESVVFKDKFEVLSFKIEFTDHIEIFNNERIKWYAGIDFGFSVDPFACIGMFIHQDCLYIYDEVYVHALEIDDMNPSIIAKFPYIVNKNVKMYADNARPEVISHLAAVRRHKNGDLIPALNIEEAPKGKDSVETGLDFMKNFKKIYIHPKCVNTIYEFKNYSYKQDKKTGEILPILVDADNHAIDAIRYGLCQLISKPRRGFNITSEFLSNMERFIT